MIKKEELLKINIHLLKTGVSKTELANRLGISKQCLNNYLSGARENLEVEKKIKAFCKVK